MELGLGGHPDFFVVHVDGHTVVVAGEVDIATADQVAAALAVPGVVAVDLSGVTFIDGAGLRALVAAPELAVIAPSPQVRRLALLCLSPG